MRFNRADMQVCERFSPVRKDVLVRVVDVWKTTLLSSRRASNRSRHVESLAGLDLGHADRYPLSLVYPVVVGGRVGLSGGGQGGCEQRRRRGVGECVGVGADRSLDSKMSGSGGGE